MSTWDNILTCTAGVGSMIAAGVYANFSARIMPMLAAAPYEEGIARMQAFNRTAEQLPFMTVFFGTAAVSTHILVRALRGEGHEAGRLLAAAGAALYLSGFALTIVWNVPLNRQLGAVLPGTEGALPFWDKYLRLWTRANTLRAVLSTLGAALLLGAMTRGLMNSMSGEN